MEDVDVLLLIMEFLYHVWQFKNEIHLNIFLYKIDWSHEICIFYLSIKMLLTFTS